MKAGQPCRICKRIITQSIISNLNKQRGINIKKAAQEAKRIGDPWGRPKVSDDLLVWSMRQSGKSLSKIAAELNISRGAVQAAIRRRAAISDVAKLSGLVR